MIRDKDIDLIAEQLKTLLSEGSDGNILTDSGNSSLQNLCANLNQLMNQQKEQKLALRASELSRQNMITNISHDLKTPLTVINGLLEQVNFDNKSTETNKLFVEKLKSKVNETQEIIVSFFDLSKLEDNAYEIELSRVPVLEVLKEVSLQFYDMIEAENLKADIDIPDTNVYIKGNVSALKRIFNNLISNAIKYGSAGNALGIRAKESVDNIDIIVWDKGKGIQEKYYDAIFERLFTLEDSRNKDFSGSGLGLSITKRLIEMQNGVIKVKSNPNIYTEFRIIFPKI